MIQKRTQRLMFYYIDLNNMTRYHTNNPIKRSWLKLFDKKTNSLEIDHGFPHKLWDFHIDQNEKFIAGKVHVAERKNYNDENENRIFFGRQKEFDHEATFQNGPISVVLDIYSESNQFEPNKDHFVIVSPRLVRKLPGSVDRPTIYLEDPSSGGRYYYYYPKNTDNKYYIKPNNWNEIFNTEDCEQNNIHII